MSFWIGVLGVPTLVVLISACIRWYRHLPQTAATDVLAAIVIFDAAVALDSEAFARFTNIDAGTIRGCAVITLILAVFLWVTAMYEVEPRVDAYYRNQVMSFPLAAWLVAWSASLAFIVAHVSFFTGRLL
jgi:hypothetical protein